MYERNVRFVRLKMYERNVHFVRLKMYEKNCTLKCWELSVNNPFGQLEIAIFSVNPKCDLRIDQKYFFHIPTNLKAKPHRSLFPAKLVD